MKQSDQVPYYAPDGTSLGFRSLAAAKRLIAGGFVKPSYGRKGHLKAIWLRRDQNALGGERSQHHQRNQGSLPTWAFWAQL